MYVLIDNYDSFTYNLYQYLSEIVDEVRVFRNDRITLEDIAGMNPKGIILSPGPGRPEQAGVTVDVVKRFKGIVPILGVCLGHQAIGYAFGANIVQAKRIVHGKADEITTDGRGLFRSIPHVSLFTRYHSLAVERTSLPEELEITAWSRDGEIMGIRHRDYAIEGVQFHPESVASEHGKRLLKNFITYRREPFHAKAVLSGLIRKTDMTMKEAEEFMEELTEGNLSSEQIAGFLVAFNSKGITAQEIAGCASVLKRKKKSIASKKPLLDTCGTGGDEKGTFNISSLAALVASASGAHVAKHGNRAVSSSSGSADFYKELGIPIDLSPTQAEKLLEKTGFAFLFAPLYHEAMRFAAQARKELAIKTIMNLVGPLSNPADAEYRLIGVYDEKLCLPVAKAAQLFGIKRALVVHGLEGIDEMSVTGPTRIVSVTDQGEISQSVFDPEDHDIPLFGLDELRGGDAKENAALAATILDGKGPAAVRESVQLNAGAALFVYGLAGDIHEGYLMAREAIASGMAKDKLSDVIRTAKKLQGIP